MYKIINDTKIQRMKDSTIIPVCEDHIDYQKYLKWINKGNTADKLPPIKPVEPTIFSKLAIVETFAEANKNSIS